MGVIEVPVDQDDHPDNAINLPGPKVVLNVLSRDVEDRKKLTEQLQTELDGDLEVIPQCRCGNIKQPLAIGGVEKVCSLCGGGVSLNNTTNMTPTVFFRAPEGVRGLFLLNFWGIMSTKFSRSGFNTLLYLTDVSYNIRNDTIITRLEKLGVTERGYNWFHDNFATILPALCTIFKNEEVSHILPMYDRYKRLIHTQHIYFPNKVFIIIENSHADQYINKHFDSISDAARGVMGIDILGYTSIRKQNMTARLLDKVANFYIGYMKNVFEGKKGGFRMHLFAAKGITVARLVIISITRPHDQNHIELPWIAGLHMMEIPLTSLLLKEGYTLNEIAGMFQRYSFRFNQHLHDLMMKLIREGHNGSLTALSQRYPTMTRGSFQTNTVVMIKTNPRDLALGVSAIGLRQMNADFDGDQLHTQLFFDMCMAMGLEPLAYYHNVLSQTNPRTLSGALELTVPVSDAFAQWNENADINKVDPDKLQSMVDEFGL